MVPLLDIEVDVEFGEEVSRSHYKSPKRRGSASLSALLSASRTNNGLEGLSHTCSQHICLDETMRLGHLSPEGLHEAVCVIRRV